MEKMNDHLKDLKQQLDKQVYSKHHYQSQKEQIIQRIKTHHNIPEKPKRFVHTIAVIAAVLLFSIISVSYMMQDNHNTPAQVDDHPLKPTAPPEKQPIPEQKEDMDEKEVITPPEEEKTAEEWIAHFYKGWKNLELPYQKIQLTYRSNWYEMESVKKTYDIKFEYRDGKFISRSDSFIEREQWSDHFEVIIDGDELIRVYHNSKTYENIDVGSDIEYDDPETDTLNRLAPLFPLNEFGSLFAEAYTWNVEEVNEAAGWVKLQANVNPQYHDYTRTKAKIKIDQDTGVILELITYAGEKVYEELFVDKFLVDDEAEFINVDTTVPSNYNDLKKIRNERVKLDDKWEIETNKIIKEDPQVGEEGFSITGEDNHLTLLLRIKEGTSEQRAKELAQKVVNVYTEHANSSSELKQKGISIWDHYHMNILIFAEHQNIHTYGGDITQNTQNGEPNIEWK